MGLFGKKKEEKSCCCGDSCMGQLDQRIAVQRSHIPVLGVPRAGGVHPVVRAASSARRHADVLHPQPALMRFVRGNTHLHSRLRLPRDGCRTLDGISAWAESRQ